MCGLRAGIRGDTSSFYIECGVLPPARGSSSCAAVACLVSRETIADYAHTVSRGTAAARSAADMASNASCSGLAESASRASGVAQSPITYGGPWTLSLWCHCGGGVAGCLDSTAEVRLHRNDRGWSERNPAADRNTKGRHSAGELGRPNTGLP